MTKFYKVILLIICRNMLGQEKKQGEEGTPSICELVAELK